MQNRIDQINGEITALKSLLRDTDYCLFRLVEDMTDCTNIVQLVSAFSAFLAKYRETVKNRRAWRAKINELEAELETIPPPEPEEDEPEMPEKEGEQYTPEEGERE